MKAYINIAGENARGGYLLPVTGVRVNFAQKKVDGISIEKFCS